MRAGLNTICGEALKGKVRYLRTMLVMKLLRVGIGGSTIGFWVSYMTRLVLDQYNSMAELISSSFRRISLGFGGARVNIGCRG